MTGFASLSWEEWQAKTRVAAQRQRKECLSWMNELWEKAHVNDWPKEWEHLRKAVRQETLWDACNVSDVENKKQGLPARGFLVRSKDPIEWEHQSWVESNVFSREREKTKVWLQLMSQWVDWKRSKTIPKTLLSKGRGQVVVEYDCSVWLTHAMQNDWSTAEIRMGWDLAHKQGWSVKEIPEEAWPRLWFLNSVSDAPKFDAGWLFEKIEQDAPARLVQRFLKRGVEITEERDSSPFLSTVQWSSSDSSGVGKGLKFWADRVNLVSEEEMEIALDFFESCIAKRKEPLSSDVVGGWAHLVSALQRVKLESKVAVSADHGSPLKAL